MGVAPGHSKATHPQAIGGGRAPPPTATPQGVAGPPLGLPFFFFYCFFKKISLFIF